MVSSFLVVDVDKENDGFAAAVSCACDEGGAPKENDGFEGALSVGFAAGAPKENADLVAGSVDDG